MADNTWFWMIFMALTLGLKHGFDLDHLATIDAITRAASQKRYLAKMVGFLFSLGHGLVVTFISLLVGSELMATNIPEWLEGFGKGISLFFLIIFGFINLIILFQRPHSERMHAGIKSYLVNKIASKKFNAPIIMLIGALFAFSFDTFSQVALFSLSGSIMSGWIFSGILGLFFTLGMMTSDGLNGFLVSMLIQRADRMAIVISRGLGFAISMFSFITAFFVVIEFF